MLASANPPPLLASAQSLPLLASSKPLLASAKPLVASAKPLIVPSAKPLPLLAPKSKVPLTTARNLVTFPNQVNQLGGGVNNSQFLRTCPLTSPSF